MFDHLRLRGKEFGIVFGYRTLLSNSCLALEAGEYARDMGKHKKFHEQTFHAYFTEELDIGRMEVISPIAARCGLDLVDMMNALKDGRYRSRLAEARKEGEKINLTGVPTFIIKGKV
jgi:predicted DsbA family dithiol-disulfide isomerase